MPRVSLPPEHRRAQILEAAQELFVTKGFEQTSVSDIVTSIDVAQGTFYYHFKSKVAVLEAVILSLVAEHERTMDAVKAMPGLDVFERWNMSVQASLRFRLRHQNTLIGIAPHLFSDENALVREKLAEANRQALVARVEALIEQGRNEGVFDVLDTAETAEAAHAMFQRLNLRLTEVWLSADKSDHAVDAALVIIRAFQTAIERCLGAPTGALKMIDEVALRTLFAEPTGRVTRE